jgi:hypothetical protein
MTTPGTPIAFVIGGVMVAAEVKGDAIIMAVDIASLTAAIIKLQDWLAANQPMPPSDNKPGGNP